MRTVDRIKGALEKQDLEAFLTEFDPEVVWLGITQPDGETPICRNRDEVRGVFETQLALGRSGRPEIVAENDERIVVDMHPEPPNEQVPELHHVLTLRAGKVVHMEDFVDRPSALAKLELS